MGWKKNKYITTLIVVFFCLHFQIVGKICLCAAGTANSWAWNRDGNFLLDAFDTGNITQCCNSLAPWGSRAWGIEFGTFQGAYDHALTAARFKSSGWDAYLYGKNLRPGRAWGYVRYIQGNMWKNGHCSPRRHFSPPPCPLNNRRIILNLDCILDTAKLLTPEDSWILAAVNLWLSGPTMPPGSDCLGRKPLVIDFYIFHQSNMKSLVPHEDEFAFHVPVALKPAVIGKKISWRRDITQHLVNAVHSDFPGLKRLGTTRPRLEDLKIYQMEFVLELVNAEAAATIDNFTLEIHPQRP